MSSDRLSGFSYAFDAMLERNRRELDALAGGSQPSRTSNASVPRSAPAPGRTAQHPGSRSAAEQVLDEKLGSGWRYEVLERTREGDELIVRCRVSAPSRGISRTLFGSAPMTGAGRSGASGMQGTVDNVKFSIGADATTAPATMRETAAVERAAIESALTACARML